MRILKLNFVACLLLSLTLPPASAAEASEMSLGQAGQLHRVLTGTYGDLFAGGQDADAVAPVLAVEIVRPGEETDRLLVPGTGDARTEARPLLFQDSTYDSFVLLWQSRGEDQHSYLHFANFDGAEWSEVYALVQDDTPVSLVNDPLITETHDAFTLDLGDGESISAERRIIHLLWLSAEEVPLARYAPLTFVEGRYVGWHGLFELTESFLLAPDGGGDGGQIELTAALARTLSLRAANDDRSVLVTLANPVSNRIGTLEISPLPLELGLLGEQVREQILALADLYDPDDMGSFSDGIRAAIVIMGQRFDMHEAFGGYVAGRVADWILETGGSYGLEGFESLGNDARDETIEASSEVYASTQADPADPETEIVRINIAALFEDEDPDPAQIIEIRVRSDRPAPAASEGPAAVYTSRGGSGLLAAWLDAENGQVLWVESRPESGGGAWSEPFTLSLGESPTIEDAQRLLAAKIR